MSNQNQINFRIEFRLSFGDERKTLEEIKFVICFSRYSSLNYYYTMIKHCINLVTTIFQFENSWKNYVISRYTKIYLDHDSSRAQYDRPRFGG